MLSSPAKAGDFRCERKPSHPFPLARGQGWFPFTRPKIATCSPGPLTQMHGSNAWVD
jgi:hypothetical protein